MKQVGDETEVVAVWESSVEAAPGASLVAQWSRIALPMQETQVRSLSWEDPHAAEQLSPWARTIEPVLHSLGAATAEPTCCNY